MSPIQQFAIKRFKIQLNTNQIEMIRLWCHGEIMYPARKAGWSTAKKVALAYLAEGLLPDEN